MIYRPDIDGIRAIAVLSVVVFHLNEHLLPGGFVGVDIFFVISGYLISKILKNELEKNTFSIWNFYDRRIRRIFPALVVMTIATTAACYLLLLPDSFLHFGRSLAAMGVFSTNILFFLQHGYFAGPSELKPLLHTWSLSVEEQFYLIYPIFLLVFVKRSKGILIFTLVAITCISYGINEYLTDISPAASFYLPIARAWELLAGALIAFTPREHRFNKIQTNLLFILGLSLIVFSLFYINPQSRFPGTIVLLPVLGTCMLLLTGSSKYSYANILIGNKPFVFIGKISYSLYLYHWPVLVLLNYYLVRNLNFVESVTVLFLLVIVSYLSYRFIENPFRQRERIQPKYIFSGSMAFLALCISLGALFSTSRGLPERFDPSIVKLTEKAKNPWRGKCLAKTADDITADEYCVHGNRENINIAVIGDSHADALIPAILESIDLDSNGIAVFTKKSCRPFYDAKNISVKYLKNLPTHSSDIGSSQSNGLNYQCGRFMEETYMKVEELNIDHVILHGRWSLQYFGTRPKSAAICYYDKKHPFCSLDNNKNLFLEHLSTTLDSFISKSVTLIGPVPSYPYEVPEALGRARLFGNLPTNDLQYTFRGLEVDREIQNLTGKSQNAVYVSIYEELCSESDCTREGNGRSYYNDSNHLSTHGGMVLTRKIAASLRTTGYEGLKPQYALNPQ